MSWYEDAASDGTPIQPHPVKPCAACPVLHDRAGALCHRCETPRALEYARGYNESTNREKSREAQKRRGFKC